MLSLIGYIPTTMNENDENKQTEFQNYKVVCVNSYKLFLRESKPCKIAMHRYNLENMQPVENDTENKMLSYLISNFNSLKLCQKHKQTHTYN